MHSKNIRNKKLVMIFHFTLALAGLQEDPQKISHLSVPDFPFDPKVLRGVHLFRLLVYKDG